MKTVPVQDWAKTYGMVVEVPTLETPVRAVTVLEA
jgi:hypothetical protein